ncbi:MAG: Fpg/Nei family DNA glycosylase [Gemmatimonadota bacterium]|nr:MAG: Fpg/Nei family DNA glycosylase [Gemmatimonadota bacterium]
MPELPEMVVIAEQMAKMLNGKVFQTLFIFQPKCLNRPEADFQKILPGKKINKVAPYGKWVAMHLSDKVRLLVSLGMGGELRSLKKNQSPPEKARVVVRFTDGTGFFIALWWFGYVHLILDGEQHPMTDTLGPDPLELSSPEFRSLFAGRRGAVKSFLLNQKRVRGIGNFYIQEILFKAHLHPLHPIPSLSTSALNRLHKAIRDVFRESIQLGSSSYELDFFGKKGKYGLNRMSFAYQDGAPCPKCGAQTRKIKTGSTAQYICSKCQVLPKTMTTKK